MLELKNIDVLDCVADALLLTIDGQSKQLRGNVAHAFIRRWPAAYEEFEVQIRFPIPLGSAVRADADTDSPWRTVIFVSTLHHLETLDKPSRLGVINLGLGSALDIASRSGLRRIAAFPLAGGWRLPSVEAYASMINTFLGSALNRQGGSLCVCCRDPAEYQLLVEEHRRQLGP